MARPDHQRRSANPTTLTALLADRAQHQPDHLAFAFLSDATSIKEQMTYAELDRAARRIAGLLRRQAVGGEPVLLLYGPCLEYVAAFFGCLYAGAIAVPAYPPHRNRSLERLRAIVRDSGARNVLCSAAVHDSLERALADTPDLGGLNWFATDLPGMDPEPWCDGKSKPETLAFLQYTSGSTSTPKGVMLSHGNLFHNAQLITKGFHLGKDSTAVFWLPLYHDMGLIGGVLQPMQIGRPSYLMAPATFLSRPLRWLQAISHFRAHISGAPNFAYELCTKKVTPEQLSQLNLNNWRVAFNGAEPVRADTLERFAATFEPCGFRAAAAYPCYGLAEATLIVTGGGHDRPPVTLTVSRAALEQHHVEIVPADHAEARTVVGCGSPLLDQRVAIVDPETGAKCPSDRPGEIWISGPSVAQGYWRRPELSAETFTARTIDGDGPYLRTGDLGFLHDGELFVTGRIKDLIILRGRNHYPQDIEQTVEQSHPSIRPACCAAFAVDENGTERLVIVAEVERSGRKVAVHKVADAVRRSVAEHHDVMVDSLVLLKPGSVPKTSSGKIQRHACKSGYESGTLSLVGRWDAETAADEAAPQQPATVGAGAIRSFLVERIARRLHLEPAALDSRQPLASFGLDSLSAVQLAGELEEWLQRPLSPVLIYDYPSIDALALHLAGEDSTATGETALSDRNRAEIAVIGIGCRFPGADGPKEFWKLLLDGRDAIVEVPSDRWNADEFFSPDPTAAGKMTTKRGGFLQAVDQFDRAYFGISPREAARMDPQQRLLLEVAAEALDDAGQDADRLSGQPVSVFVGISSNDYGRLQMGDPADLDAYVGTGNAMSIAANRLSFAFDFRGPSLAVDTACSSSLVAVHLACQSLRRGESRLAVAAGANLILTPDLTINFSRANMMAPDGKCKAFDAAADGYVRSEGVGVVILKPLAQAVADGDRIYAVVRGSAINQDGRSNGLTAPNRQSQEAVLRAAYADAGVNPATVDAIEAHGTGTSLGDPIEALAIGHVLAIGRSADRPAWVGSVKTNIGHLEAAAGVAGFIKMALALHHGVLPRSLHFTTPNPHIPFADLPIRVANETQRLTARNRRAIAGVSSFGFGGTNAHVVLQAVEPLPARAEPTGVAHLVPISARSAPALLQTVERWLERPETDDASIVDLAHTAARRHTHLDHRIAVVARDRYSLRDQLKAHLDRAPRAGLAAGRRIVNREPRTAFVFSGQGSQWWGMGRRLLETEPVFRDAVGRCDSVFRPLAGWSIVELLTTQNDANRLDDTDVVQPAIFALQIGIAELLRSWGISPAAVVGHSLGEIAAACVAGALDLADGLRVVLHRARLQHSTRGRGRMAAVGLSAEESQSALRGFETCVSVAAINGPRATVWSGDPTALEAALQQLRDRDVFHRLLRGQVAFHSPQMEALRGEFVTALNGFRPRGGNVKYVSTVTGRHETGESLTSDYWSRNLREPVAFAAAIETLLDAEIDAFVEIGPHPTLVDSIQQTLKTKNRTATVVGTMRRDEDDRASLLSALGALYVIGAPIAWDRVENHGRHVDLPSYPWQRERCWHAVTPAARPSAARPAATPAPIANDHWLVRSTWESLEAPAPAGSLAGHWLIVGDKPAVLDRLAESLESRSAAVIRVLLAEETGPTNRERFTVNPIEPEQWRRLLRDAIPTGTSLRGIVFAAGLTAPGADGLDLARLNAAQDRCCTALLHLVQASVHYGMSARFWIATRGAQAVRDGDAPVVAAAPLWGLGRVLAHEHPELRPTLIDLDPQPLADDFARLADLLAAESEIDQWARRDGRTYAARLVPGAGYVPTGDLPIRNDATYLITGGLGGLGLAVARWLVDRGARSLVLTSRRGPTPAVEPALAALRGRGVAIATPAVDVADRDQMAELIETIDHGMPPLRGLMHLAGVLDDGIVLHQNRERLWSVLRAKVQGAWNLHTLTADRHLDIFALFSSAASLLGSPGQANYAAANAFLDALSHFRRARGLQAVSVNWGPWAEVGMAARDSRQAKLAGAGMSSIGVDEGLAILERIVASGVAQIGVVPVDRRAWKRFAPAGEAPYYLAALAGTSDDGMTSASPVPVASTLDRAGLLAAPIEDWPAVLENQLRAQTARVLKLPTESLDVEQPLNNVGIDSLMAIELKNRIEADLGATVPMVKFLEGPSVRDLAGFLSEQLIPALAPRRQTTAGHHRNGKLPAAGRNGHSNGTTAAVNESAGDEPDAIDAGQLLARLDSLSDAEVDSLLSELCDAEKGV